MIKKLFFAILKTVEYSGIAGVILGLVFVPRYVEDVELRCKVDMQLARLASAMTDRNVFIMEVKEFCESMKEQEKWLKDVEKERKEYYSKKSKSYGN